MTATDNADTYRTDVQPSATIVSDFSKRLTLPASSFSWHGATFDRATSGRSWVLYG